MGMVPGAQVENWVALQPTGPCWTGPEPLGAGSLDYSCPSIMMGNGPSVRLRPANHGN